MLNHPPRNGIPRFFGIPRKGSKPPPDISPDGLLPGSEYIQLCEKQIGSFLTSAPTEPCPEMVPATDSLFTLPFSYLYEAL